MPSHLCQNSFAAADNPPEPSRHGFCLAYNDYIATPEIVRFPFLGVTFGTKVTTRPIRLKNYKGREEKVNLLKRIYFSTRTGSARQRLCSAVAGVAFAAFFLSFGSPAFAREIGDRWAAVWAASPTGTDDVSNPPTFNYQSVRQIARVAFAGTGATLRVRLTNELGKEAVFVGDAHIALAGANGSIMPLFSYPLTFTGETSVTIRPGSPVLSEPVKIAGRGAR